MKIWKSLRKRNQTTNFQNKIVTTFKKFNNTDKYLDLMYKLTKDTLDVYKARSIRILYDVSMGIANSEYDLAKENCIHMHKEFLQSLETEFEETLHSTKGFEWAKLKNQIAVFEVMHWLENAINIYSNFFCNEVKVKSLSSGETDESKYQAYLDEVLSDVLRRLKREFDVDEGRLQIDFPHRSRFSSSLISKYITGNLKSFILTWLETEEKSRETFLAVLYLTIRTFKKFKEDLNRQIDELKIEGEINAESLIDEIFLPFRKMYLQKEQSVIKSWIEVDLENKSKQLKKYKMTEANFEFEKGFFDKINLNQFISKSSSESNERENFFKLTMLLEPALYDSIVAYTSKMFERWNEVPLEEDKFNVIKALTNNYIDKIGGYFSEIWLMLTDYLDAVNQEQSRIEEGMKDEEKKERNKMKSKNVGIGEAIDSAKDWYKPPAEYFKFIFAFEKLVKILISQFDKILNKISENKALVSVIEVSRGGLLSNMGTMIKMSNQEFIAKIHLHCHFILAKNFKKIDYGAKKGGEAYSNVVKSARDDLYSFLSPFLKFLILSNDAMSNGIRLYHTIAGGAIEALIAHFSKFIQNKKLSYDFSDDIIEFNELFQDIQSEQIKIIYDKFKYMLSS